jgi:hypothetical protein
VGAGSLRQPRVAHVRHALIWRLLQQRLATSGLPWRAITA